MADSPTVGLLRLNGTEPPIWTGYRRAALPTNFRWAARNDGVLVNDAEIEFPRPRKAWGLIVGGFIEWTNGVRWDFPLTRAMDIGDRTPIIRAGGLEIITTSPRIFPDPLPEEVVGG